MSTKYEAKDWLLNSLPKREDVAGKIRQVSFSDAVLQSFDAPDFVEQFDRLCGTSLHKSAQRRTPLEAAIDSACGVSNATPEEDLMAFISFVFHYVWVPYRASMRILSS